jgi:lipopolysaccharide transport system ATP-binding protein
MGDVARQGRTVMFVSHNMSAILRLTEESLVIQKGALVMRAPSAEAVSYYLTSGFSQEGQKYWLEEDVPADAAPFKPIAIRILNSACTVNETMRSTEKNFVEIEYEIAQPIAGLRVGLYLNTSLGEVVFTTFDTDEPQKFEQLATRPAGHYISRCTIPGDILNEGRYILGVNASSYRVKRYFQDEQALTFSVDSTGAPGKQWPEPRLGPVRPRLDWSIETV